MRKFWSPGYDIEIISFGSTSVSNIIPTYCASLSLEKFLKKFSPCFYSKKVCWGQDWNTVDAVRTSHTRFSMKKGALENFAKFTGKHLHLFLKKKLLHRCFPANYMKLLRTPLGDWTVVWLAAIKLWWKSNLPILNFC